MATVSTYNTATSTVTSKRIKHEIPMTVGCSDEIMELIRLGAIAKYGDKYMNFKTTYWKNGYNMITKVEITCEKNIVKNEELILDK